MAEFETLLTGNEIFEARTQGVGYIDPQQADCLWADWPDGTCKWHKLGFARQSPLHGLSRNSGQCQLCGKKATVLHGIKCALQEIYESIRLCRVRMDKMPGWRN